MLAEKHRADWVPQYYKKNRETGKLELYCPNYNREFWVGLIFTLFEDQWKTMITPKTNIDNVRMGQFNLQVTINSFLATPGE